MKDYMSINKPTVTVIIPTCNRADKIFSSVQSVLNQTFDNFELIVVDDASSDNTKQIVNIFSDQRIRYICHSRNKGGSAARNTGIKESQGEFIAFLDDDDEWYPDHLQVTVDTLNKLDSSWGVVYTGKLEITSKKSKKIYPNALWEGLIQNNLLVYGSIGTPSILVRRLCFEHIGLFDEDFPRHQDWEMHIRIANKYKYYPIKKITIKVNKGELPISKSVVKSKKLFFRKFDEYIKQLSWLEKRRFYAKHYNDLAKHYFNERYFLKGLLLLIKAICSYPLWIKMYLSTIIRLFK